ncbi:MAG: class I SAM-dependent methyltransferase family protein [Candidatus Odinarchaeota archaeon]
MTKISRRRSTFHEYLTTELGTQIPSELLPRRLRLLGHVAVLWLHPQVEQFKELIGQTVLRYSPKIRSVLRRTAAISGPFRQPAVELIAGSPETETVFKENNVIFHLDPMKVMFSLGNKSERLRMSQVGSGEIVIDMFTGIGQFSLPLAVHAHPTVVHAIEWNPDAFEYLNQNIVANKISKIVKSHFGDSAIIAPEISQGCADRVIMGLIQGTSKYIKPGILSLRSGGIMHFHEVGPKEKIPALILSNLENSASLLKREITLLETRIIKTYNPQLNHFVLDVQIN